MLLILNTYIQDLLAFTHFLFAGPRISFFIHRLVISWLKLQLHLQSSLVYVTAYKERKGSGSLHIALVTVEILFPRLIQPHIPNLSLARTAQLAHLLKPIAGQGNSFADLM